MIELVPLKQFSQRISDGWTLVEGYEPRSSDYAVVMRAPAGCETVRSTADIGACMLYRDPQGNLCREDGRPRPYRPVKVKHAKCTLPGCSSPHHGKGFCHKHYKRWKYQGHPRIVGKPGPKPKVCA